jgi:hypothetical protein
MAIGAGLPLALLVVLALVLARAEGAPAESAGGVEVVAAGDIACDPGSPVFNNGLGRRDACRQAETAALVGRLAPAAVLALGDTQYFCGGYEAYLHSYGPTWGKLLARTYPVPGNHEYLTTPGKVSDSEGGGTGCDPGNAGAAGYFKYFAAAPGHGTPGQGWYSFDLGGWHLIALNSSCGQANGCGSTRPEGKWLAADLAAHQHQCVLAFWHIPVWSSGGRAQSNAAPFVQQLTAAHADLVLTGHDHIYERFAQQNAGGVADPAGVREFVVGTGGANHTGIAAVARNSEMRLARTFGVLDLVLYPTGYEWRFVDTSDHVLDSGRSLCHNTAQTQPPAPPTPPRLTVHATSTRRAVAVGKAARISISVRNSGATRAPRSHLEVVLPAGLQAVSKPKGAASCFVGDTIECALGPLSPRHTANVSVSVRATKAGRLPVRATASAGEPIARRGRSHIVVVTAG